jgi:NAD-dependent DNA ligase
MNQDQLVTYLTYIYNQGTGYMVLASALDTAVITLSQLDQLIDVADDTYYNGSDRDSTLLYELPDSLYDWLRVFRNQECANFGYAPRNDVPGALPSRKVDTEHPEPYRDLLGGIDYKSTQVEDVYHFIGDNEYAYATPKIDGASALIVASQKSIQMITRGRQGRGMDVTNKLTPIHLSALFEVSRYLKSILATDCPDELRNRSDLGEYALKVEVYMSHESFCMVNHHRVTTGAKPYANERSAVSGILGRIDNEYIEYLEYAIIKIASKWRSMEYSQRIAGVSYTCTDEDVEYIMSTSDQTYKRESEGKCCMCMVLANIGWFVPRVETSQHELTSDLMDQDPTATLFGFSRVAGAYNYKPMDGIVIVNVKDETMAYKFAPQGKLTVVQNIETNMGRSGAITPTVLVAPVELNGTLQGRITGTNYYNLQAQGIGIGSYVTVTLNNDVIPYISEVHNTEKLPIPTSCPYCNSVLIASFRNMMCVNEDCYELNTQRLMKYIETFVSNFGIGEVTVRTLGRIPGFRPTHLYSMTPEYLANLGLSSHYVKTLVDLQREVLFVQPVYDYQLLQALWFPSVGQRRGREIAASITTVKQWLAGNITTVTPNSSTTAFLDMFYPDSPNYNQAMSAAAEMHRLIFQVLEPLQLFRTFRNIANKINVNIVVTGSLPYGHHRDTFVKWCDERGIYVGKTVSRNTHYVVAGSNPTFNKITRANNLNIPVISYDEFIKIINS